VKPLVTLDGIGKEHRLGSHTVQALSHISMEIHRGEFVAVTGPSGSGKSTLLSILGLLDHPSRGHYLFGGQTVLQRGRKHLAELRNRHIGFVFQNFKLLPDLTALENVALPLFYRRERLCDPSARTRMALEQVGLGTRAGHSPARLSGGEQQRVAIARALSRRPKLILADEPTGNLDRKTGGHVIDLLFGLQRRREATLILVTHDERLAGACDRTIRMADGAVESETEALVS